MSAADRLEDGFPHGTREGYEQGCRGSRCPATEEGWLSCAQARTRYQSDYAYRKRVDAGLSPAQLAEVDEREAAEQRAQLAAARARREGAPAPVVSLPAPVPAPAPVAAEEVPRIRKHGTYNGYNQGCRDEDACPSKVAGGISCVDARREYKRGLRERAGASLGAVAKAVAEKPTTPTLGVSRVEAVAVEQAEISSELPAAETLREQLAEATALTEEAERDFAEAVKQAAVLETDLAAQMTRADRAEKDVAVLELKLTDALARNASLTDRVATLAMELDVAKAANATAAAVERRHEEPMLLQPLAQAPSRFRFARDEQGGVVVDVEGSEPGFVRFEVDEAGTLTGVAVQSGK